MTVALVHIFIKSFDFFRRPVIENIVHGHIQSKGTFDVYEFMRGLYLRASC